MNSLSRAPGHVEKSCVPDRRHRPSVLPNDAIVAYAWPFRTKTNNNGNKIIIIPPRTIETGNILQTILYDICIMRVCAQQHIKHPYASVLGVIIMLTVLHYCSDRARSAAIILRPTSHARPLGAPRPVLITAIQRLGPYRRPEMIPVDQNH